MANNGLAYKVATGDNEGEFEFPGICYSDELVLLIISTDEPVPEKETLL